MDEFGIPILEDKNLKKDFESLKHSFGKYIMRHINEVEDAELKDLIVKIDSLIMSANDKLSVMEM